MVLLRQGALVLFALAAGCSIQFLEEGPYEESFPTSGQSTIEIGGIDGDVIVVGVEGQSSAVIRGTRRAIGSTTERARANLRFARLEPRLAGAELILEFIPPLEKVGLVDLELDRPSSVPRTLGLALDVEVGDLTVTDLQGVVMLGTGEGDVTVVGGGPGMVEVESGDGDVTVEASGAIGVVADGAALVSVTEVDASAVNVETAGRPLTFELVPQPVDIFCYPDGGGVSIDPLLLLEQQADVADGGTWYKSADPTTPRRVVKLWSRGGDISVSSRP